MMANVLVKNNGASYIVLATPNKLLGALVPRVKLNALFDVIDTPP
jgi:hypothetical protein